MDNSKLTAGTRVSLDMTTLTIMRALPREVNPYWPKPVPETVINLSGLGTLIRLCTALLHVEVPAPVLSVLQSLVWVCKRAQSQSSASI